MRLGGGTGCSGASELSALSGVSGTPIGGISWSLSEALVLGCTAAERAQTASTWRRTIRPSFSSTWYESGPRTSMILPGNQLLAFGKSLTYTLSSTLKVRNSVLVSWFLFCAATLDWTVSVKLGLRRSSLDRGRLPNSSSAGGTPVVEWGVSLY